MLDVSEHIVRLAPWAKALVPTELTWPQDWATDEHCQSWFAPPPLETLLHQVTEQASRVAGVQLYPVNSFLRRYEHGATLQRHVDKAEIEWTASLRLYHDGPEWPLQTTHGPMTGDTVFIKSGAIEHWRDPFPGVLSVIGLLHWHSHPSSQAPPPHQPLVSPQESSPIVPSGCPAFVYVPQVLQPYQLRTLYDQLDESTLGIGLVDTGIRGEHRPQERANSVGWLGRTHGWSWLYDQLFYTAEAVNHEYWQLDIRGPVAEDIQFTRYAVGEFYDWHVDADIHRPLDGPNGNMALRSVSVVVLLRPATFGGGLELKNGGVIHLNPGDAVIFPSTEKHRALPVAEGQRDCLVLWLAHH